MTNTKPYLLCWVVLIFDKLHALYFAFHVELFVHRVTLHRFTNNIVSACFRGLHICQQEYVLLAWGGRYLMSRLLHGKLLTTMIPTIAWLSCSQTGLSCDGNNRFPIILKLSIKLSYVVTFKSILDIFMLM